MAGKPGMLHSIHCCFVQMTVRYGGDGGCSRGRFLSPQPRPGRGTDDLRQKQHRRLQWPMHDAWRAEGDMGIFPIAKTWESAGFLGLDQSSRDMHEMERKGRRSEEVRGQERRSGGAADWRSIWKLQQAACRISQGSGVESMSGNITPGDFLLEAAPSTPRD
jgi:hypothetical protein